ncbi:MAG: pilus assembly protein FimV [Candidatus Azotimanducaceae bacterium]|jgi:pilus assembly protein FimV
MIQRLSWLAAIILAFSASAAFGLGLGKLDLKSALNQQFKAEVELTGVRDLAVEEILVSLASPKDFQRIGVERIYALTDLRFTVIDRGGGSRLLRITSTRPITEPYLNFLVEALWPSGRILREYTVLLDPPVFTEGGAAPLQAAKVQRAAALARPSAPQPSTPIRRKATRIVEPAASTSSSELQEGRVDESDYGVTGAGDTLWKIALKVRPDNRVTVQQTMLALKEANPRAFINNNINLLKAGYVLRIPDSSEISNLSAVAALDEVRAQNDDFDAYRDGRPVAQLDGAARRNPSQEGDAAGESGELKLLAAGSGGDGAGQRSGGENSSSGDLQGSLAVAREDLDRSRRANADLTTRLDDLSGQIETLNEIVTLKNDQLAALRAEILKAQASAGNIAPVQANDSLLANPYVLGGLGILLIGGLIAGLLVRKRRQDPTELDNDDFDPQPLEETSVDDEEDTQSSESLTIDAIGDFDEDVSPETSDVLGEVEIYIAYGRFPQAIGFLEKAIDAEPMRTDLRLKLLEVLVQTGDGVAFNLALEQLRPLGDAAALEQALTLQAEIPGAAEDASAAMDATMISDEPIVAIEAPLDGDDDELSFDLDDLDSETEEDVYDFDGADDLELDLDADDSGSAKDDKTVILETPVVADPDELDLDLDLGGETLSLDGELDLDDDLDLDDGELDLDDNELDLDDDELDLDDDLDLDLDGELDLDEELDLDTDEDLTMDELSLDTVDEDDAPLIEEADLALSVPAATVDLDDDELSRELDKTLSLESEDAAFSLDDDALSVEDDGLTLDLEDEELSFDEADEDGAFSLDLDDDELDLEDDGFSLDEDVESKMNLARAYIDMDDKDGARKTLGEILEMGNDAEVKQAKALLEQVG